MEEASVFSALPERTLDPILGLTQLFNADNADAKLNVGVGAYRDDEGSPYYFRAVRRAETELLASPTASKEYLPICGLSDLRQAAAELLFGAECEALRAGRIAVCQALSGTGALRLGFELLRQSDPSRRFYLPNATWSNHLNIAAHAGVGDKLHRYCYLRPGTTRLDFEGMVQDLAAAPSGSVVLLHMCAHNPTGVDPTAEQWQRLLELFQSKRHVALFDAAYQGFATGDVERDAMPVRLFVTSGLDVVCAQSFAKNMGLYGERVGCVSVVAPDSKAADRVLGALERLVRASYSSPPRHGAEVAAHVLRTPALRAMWLQELQAITARIRDLRIALFEELQRLGTPGTWECITQHVGMFTYTGLSRDQVLFMRSKHHVYMTEDGRISIAGLRSAQVPQLAAAIHDAVTSAKGS